jgi:hypothetical protein
MTYDAAHGQVVMFGGFGAGGDLNDTWLWNGTNWTQANPANSPSPRSAEPMVYDAAHGKVVLFGGLYGASTRYGDTWLWDGTNWAQQSPANSPSARASGVMVYDAAHGNVILFGGVNASGSIIGDTWLWNGANWTQASPAHSPSARADYTMVYDAAHSQVVLFGGRDVFGSYLNDTWAWNGTDWIQQTPANSPPARYVHGMAYDAALGQTVMFGGYNGGGYLNDTWVWDGTNWTQENSAANPSGRYAPKTLTYDAPHGQVVLFGGYNGNQLDDTWTWDLSTNFGNVNVCPSGHTTPAPCSRTHALTYNIPVTTTFGTTQVVTQGTPGLDFKLGSGSTCTGTVSPATCTVNVTFAPLAPGLRQGAVQLFDNSGNLLATTQVYGNGQGSAVAFGPGTQTLVNTTASYPLFQPKGVTVDAAGNLFIADNGNHRVVKVAANGTTTTVGIGLNYPQGMAVDGAGDLFIADNNLNELVEVPAGCTSIGCQRYLGTSLRAQLGVAVDGAGNVFFGDFLDHEVVEVPANGRPQTVVYSPGSGSNPVGLAVDAAGDLFIADFGLAKVVEVPAGCTSSACQISVGSGWVQPEAVAVDAAGDIFVADEAPKVVEVPAGCTSIACQITVSGILAYGVAVDGRGNVFIPELNGNGVVEINRSQPLSLSFASTNVGSTSNDSPQAVTLQNVGNQTLGAITPGLVVNGPNFVEVAGPGTPADCSATFSLTPGAECNLSISFGPLSAGNPLTSTAVFTDNALNATPATQTIALSGIGIQVVPSTVAVPNVVGQMQAVATTTLTGASLTLGTVSTAFSRTVPSGSVISQDPAVGTQVTLGSTVALVVSTGQPPAPNQLSLQNNYFVTGDYASAGVTLRGTGQGGMATRTITIPNSSQSGVGVPDGADILEAYLYWQTVESTPSPSASSGTFRGYPITGQQIGSDLPYTDGTLSGTLRVYRADVNAYFPSGANGIRFASGAHTVSLPDGGGSALPLTEGASLVVIYRVMSPNFPLKAVVIYDGSAIPTTTTGPIPQTVEGFYDAVGGANGTGELTNLFAAGGSWNNSPNSVTLGQSNQFTETLNPGNAYAAVILSTPLNNSDNDGILDAWKTGPGAGDFHAGQPGYYDVKTGSWVPLPGAQHGQKDLFVQLDYMCGAVMPDGTCDPTKENLFPSPDTQGRDPLAMVQQAFAAHGVHLHLEIGNAVPEDTCTDSSNSSPPQLCQFPDQPGVISWKNSLEISKAWPRNFASCVTGGDCTTRFPYGQKDSYHYVLFGHSLAIPAWNSRFGTLTSIQVVSGVTTIVTTDRGNGINACPSRVTISGVLGNPSLNGVYNTTGCADTKTITVATPGVPNWSYPNNTLPEPVIGLTSGTITSISGYSDLGGSDSAVTLGLWATAPNQDMSKRANVQAGTMFHEIGHTLGLGHGGLYYDTAGSYIPTFEANCKTNYQSSMNYLFQLDGVGPNQAVDFSGQTLTTLYEAQAGSVNSLTDISNSNAAATNTTSAWYVPYTAGTTTASPATRHCDGTPLNGGSAYRVDGPIAPITPPWSNGQDINFDGQLNSQMRGYNDWANIDLRQVGATGGGFASLASVLSFGSSSAPLDIAAGGNVTLGSGGTVALGSGGTVTLGSGGNVTLGSGGTITLGSGGNVTLGSGGNVTLGSGGTVTPGSGGTITLGSGGNVTLSSAGTITLGSGGTVTLGSGGTVTLGSGGTIALGSGGTVTVAAGGSYTIPASGGTITLGSGGNVTLGSGGNVTLGSGGTIALGSGGNVTLGSGGNVTLGSGGTIALGSGGNITLGSGGNVTLGSGGTVTLGSGGNLSGSGGNVTLGSGGNVTLGSGGTVTLGSGGNVTLGSGGNVTLGSGGTITLGSGGNVTLGSGGNVTLGSGGTITLGSGGTVVVPAGGSYTIPASGGTITLGSGGNVTLGSGGNVTLGSGGTITLGSGGTITLGSGGNVTLGSGGVVTLGSGGNVTLGSGGNVTLGSGGNVTLGSGGVTTTELTYETANSIVRPPSSPTETPTPAGVRINWMAPAFGVVQTYAIYRSSDGATPILVGSVSGVNGYPPATTFTDTNPDLTSHTVIYTISTTLVPDTGTSTQRQSPPSPPAVLRNDQTIVLGPLPSSVTISSTPPTVTATAETGGNPNGLQVSFSATGSCSIGSQSITSGVSSATVALNSTGSCTITASQSGTSGYNAADPASGKFTILPQGSTTTSQTINFATLQNVQYGNTFSLSASSSSNLPVSFNASGPCTTSGATTGVGLCTITASAPGNSTYSAASVSQSFTIYPAVLKVTANNLVSNYGQPLPSLTYACSGFVNGDSVSVVSGTPALSTTATTTSKTGNYPITVTTGTLATTNYSFLYVSGTLTIQPAPLTITASTFSFVYGSPVPAVTGQATGFVNGENSSVITTPPTCTTNANSMSPVSGDGSYSSSCAGAFAANYTISYLPGVVTVTPANSSTTLASSSPSATSNYMQVVTFTATVADSLPGSTGAPTGTVTFYSNGSSIGSGTLSVTNCGTPPCTIQAIFSTTSLAAGANNITVSYSGDGAGFGDSYGDFYASNQGGSTATGLTQTVTPVPLVSLNPTSLSFGNTNVGKTSSGATITLTNVGDAPLSLGSGPFVFTGPNSGDFAETSNCGSSLGYATGSNSCTITVTFTPSDTGVETAALQITDNDDGTVNALQYVSLTGAGLSTITGTSLYTDAIFATSNNCGSITVSGGSSVNSFNSSLGYSSSQQNSGGNIGTNGNVTLNGSVIYGSAAVDALTTGSCSKSAVTGLTSSGGAQVTGGLILLNGPVTYPAPPAPNPVPPTTTQNIAGACPAGMTGCNNTGSKAVSLLPGQYGNVTASGGTTVHFRQGTYNFNSLALIGNSTLYVDSGPVIVNLAGVSLTGSSPAMDVSGGGIRNPTHIPANLQFTYGGSRGVNLSGGSDSYATVYAPNALVNMSGGADFFGSMIGSTVTSSGGTAVHYDSNLPNIGSGSYIWFTAVVNNLKNLPTNQQVKLYMTNARISFTANGTQYSNLPVPNGVITFNSSSLASGASTAYDNMNNRWSTNVSKTGLTGNTFVSGLAYPVPANFPTGIQNVTFSASFSTDTPGITLEWQWSAGVYTQLGATYAAGTNNNVLGVNPEDGSADAFGTDPAGTPESFKGYATYGATGGYFSAPSGVVPTVAQVSVSPSSLTFTTQPVNTSSPKQSVTLTNNYTSAFSILNIAVSGTNAADFAESDNCPRTGGGFTSTCTITVTFTPTYSTFESAKIVITDTANNSPQTVYLTGTGQ